jgi:hypothetical protein
MKYVLRENLKKLASRFIKTAQDVIKPPPQARVAAPEGRGNEQRDDRRVDQQPMNPNQANPVPQPPANQNQGPNQLDKPPEAPPPQVPQELRLEDRTILSAPLATLFPEAAKYFSSRLGNIPPEAAAMFANHLSFVVPYLGDFSVYLRARNQALFLPEGIRATVRITLDRQYQFIRNRIERAIDDIETKLAGIATMDRGLRTFGFAGTFALYSANNRQGQFYVDFVRMRQYYRNLGVIRLQQQAVHNQPAQQQAQQDQQQGQQQVQQGQQQVQQNQQPGQAQAAQAANQIEVIPFGFGAFGRSEYDRLISSYYSVRGLASYYQNNATPSLVRIIEAATALDRIMKVDPMFVPSAFIPREELAIITSVFKSKMNDPNLTEAQRMMFATTIASMDARETRFKSSLYEVVHYIKDVSALYFKLSDAKQKEQAANYLSDALKFLGYLDTRYYGYFMADKRIWSQINRIFREQNIDPSTIHPILTRPDLMKKMTEVSQQTMTPEEREQAEKWNKLLRAKPMLKELRPLFPEKDEDRQKLPEHMKELYRAYEIYKLPRDANLDQAQEMWNINLGKQKEQGEK